MCFYTCLEASKDISRLVPKSFQGLYKQFPVYIHLKILLKTESKRIIKQPKKEHNKQ